MVKTDISRFTYDGWGRNLKVHLWWVGTDISWFTFKGLERISPSLPIMGWSGYLLVYLERIRTDISWFTFKGLGRISPGLPSKGWDGYLKVYLWWVGRGLRSFFSVWTLSYWSFIATARLLARRSPAQLAEAERFKPGRVAELSSSALGSSLEKR